MFIHICKEGDKKHLGINLMFMNKNTFLAIILCIPIWFFLPKNYLSFYHGAYYYGKQIKVCYLRFRIRRWNKFPANIKKYIYSYSTGKIPFGKQKLVCTIEMIEDRICTTPIGC